MDELLGSARFNAFAHQALNLWQDGYMGISIKRVLIALAVMLVALMLRRPVASLSLVRFDQHGPMLAKHGDRSHLPEALDLRPGT